MSTQPQAAQSEWWERPDRHYDAGGDLRFAGRSVGALAAELGTPTFVYCAARISQNVTRLRRALDGAGMLVRLFYAMKANRYAPLLRHMRGLGVGIDACSPNEVRHALDCGFREAEISFTATSLSRADHEAIAGWPDMLLNLDAIAALPPTAERSPGRAVGLRINPAIGIGYADNEKLRYAGARPSKFGIYLDRFSEALEKASHLGLDVVRLHCHAGCGFLDPQRMQLDALYAAIGRFLDLAPGVRELNLGGGLGVPQRAGDTELDLAAWVALLKRHFGGRGLQLAFEPGDYFVKDAGALLTEVTHDETKGGVRFVGVNAGFNLHPEPAYYQRPLQPVPARRAPLAGPATVAGNINEALDLWIEDEPLPPLEPGDVLCWLNAGGYGAAMASSHCLRGDFREHWLAPVREKARLTEQAISELSQGAWDTLYGSTGEPIWGNEPLPFLARFGETLRSGLRAPSRLLDAGVGEGRNLPFLLSLGADRVDGIDASARALAKVPEAIRARVHLQRAQLADTGLPGASIDAALLLDTFETLPDADRVLNELHRVLKPGGLLLCNTPGLDDGVAGVDMRALSDNAFLYRSRYYFHFVSPDEAIAMFEAAGFEVVSAEHCAWVEAPHPGFRDETHGHASHVLLARRRGDAA
ncbi:methyltransferase domain-containing protein [Pseudomarimonas salicorniae]|uniref:Methyltransferase domain-containing protein n=1 Tax=Pseudomarimonas salicorniae TaxID=2933270 RepID=A0ABT0GMD8_9GAMM|nr:methyltransferase domain-containing protein [Lysobacter sp. CAU 1642]MCK7595603.1 methyltransferase domain-containing protein [Lysobacter sp. CAU 1642]